MIRIFNICGWFSNNCWKHLYTKINFGGNGKHTFFVLVEKCYEQIRRAGFWQKLNYCDSTRHTNVRGNYDH